MKGKPVFKDVVNPVLFEFAELISTVRILNSAKSAVVALEWAKKYPRIESTKVILLK